MNNITKEIEDLNKAIWYIQDRIKQLKEIQKQSVDEKETKEGVYSPEEEKFILDFEINLGEIIIALDKIIEESQKKEIPKEEELLQLDR